MRPGARVLLIDDEPDLRRLAEVSLGAVGGWKVTSCGSGAEGVQAALREVPDLVLLDVQMPGLDGPQTLAALRREPALAEVAVVFLTATRGEEDLARLRALGARGVVHKPFDPFTLPGQVLAALGEPS
jgi:CheY-like chemotaxis protein